MVEHTDVIPVITIDGPGGTGKGTLGLQLAKALNLHFLDSGSLYRVLAEAAILKKTDEHNERLLANYALTLPVHFSSDDPNEKVRILLDNQDVTEVIRTEQCANLASKISALPAVRTALLARQRAFRVLPGLVTDGRDMGTIVFPDAVVKFYLDASAEARAFRRFNQLKAKGLDANLAQVLTDIETRDERDKNRAVAPLKPADDAIVIDTTHLSVSDVFAEVYAITQRRLKLAGISG